MTLVVDASVAIKWFVTEPDSAAATRVASGHVLLAPEPLVAEVANGVWRAARVGRLGWSDADAAVASLRRFFLRLEAGEPIGGRALEIARSLDHPAYDRFYVALAERERAPLVTADERLVRKVAGTAFVPLVRPLAGF